MQHLLLVSLGPIQDFIASARRCQDLWFGSWVLSDLARTVALNLQSAGGATLIFPEAPGNDRVAVANKILALLPEGRDPGEVATAGRVALQDRVGRLATEFFSDLRTRNGAWDPGFRGDLARSQLAELMEYLWVSVPMTAQSYAAARERAEELLTCRKITRTWGPVTTGLRAVPKSSLDGLRESVLTEHLRTLSPERRRVKYGVRGSEQLCGVGLLKRLGCEVLIKREERNDDLLRNGRPVFHSTSHTAAGPLLTRIARQGSDAREALKTYLSTLKEVHGLSIDRRFSISTGDVRTAVEVRHPWDETAPPDPARVLSFGGAGYDAVLLFENRLDDVISQSISLPDDARLAAARVREVRDAVIPNLRQFLKKLGVRVSSGRPTPYYALVLADGDHMGRAIDLVARTAPHDALANHQRLGRRLDEFALGCLAHVEAHGGSLIYAGGDDVLALVPLHTVLACVRKLREEFARAVARMELFPLRDDDGNEVRPTLSVGVAIVHHLDAMSDARKLAKDAEGIAKNDGRRDALAIVASKRSGDPITAYGKWEPPDGSVPLDRRLVAWGKALAAGALPDGVAWALEEAVAPFDVSGGAGASEAVIRSLVKRVLSRRRDAQLDPLDDEVRQLLDSAFTVYGATVAGVRRMSEEIQLARVFLSAWDDAWEVCP